MQVHLIPDGHFYDIVRPKFICFEFKPGFQSHD